MGREEPGTHARRWTSPDYRVDEGGKVVGGYRPSGPHNWGRWGDADVRGTTNLITAEVVLKAAGLVHSGEVISLALPIDDSAPRWPSRPPARHYFTMSGSDAVVGSPYNAAAPGAVYLDDGIDMSLQGSTQWDGLAHFTIADSTYNGHWVGNVTALGGAVDTGIHHQRESLVGRGVLLDVARHLGVDSLEPGTAIGPDVLDEVAAAQGVEVGTGDMVLVRTGYLSRWWTLEDTASRERYFTAVPGLGHACVPWFRERDIAALATDTVVVEVVPAEADAPRRLPVHHGALVDLGLTLGEFWDLDRLGVVCAADERYDFLLVAPPLHIRGAVGSVLNPVAIR
ncbi:cyclase family protein [Pseudonocardia halophobica]|uniref:Cyclase n=1 Tax=Pseudonocardia halophobica TaxID=29401 RepID=A0A9W6KYT0_9PSEU|nr:cyclase family protein [Pseudonocardia halophobica]GLL10592.1 cyclase [Pseudonocardia halophobica]